LKSRAYEQERTLVRIPPGAINTRHYASDAGRKFVSFLASRAGSNPEHKKTSLAGGFFMARSAGFELTTF
jgi:hypothetical protein